jgi:phenylpropionate dioxygenase-like ring-hydroxylating dioxygenase large terminal subunit
MDEDQKFVERGYYVDQAIFENETEAIFARTWQFVAHESELKKPGDFKRASVAGRPLLIVRSEDRKVRGFFNTCRHRGSIVEERAAGNCHVFKCPYHHWRYSTLGSLVNATMPKGYGGWFSRGDYGLIPIPRMESLFGLIFVSLDAEIRPLAEYLDRPRPHLEYQMGGSVAWEMVDSYSYQIRANWKLFMENTVESYHANFLHQLSIRQLRGTRGKSVGQTIELGPHGLLEWWNSAVNGGRPKTRQTRKHVLVFPNLLTLYHGDRDIFAIRHVIPEEVDRTRVTVYAFGRKGESSAARQARLERVNVVWGPGGRNGADDVHALELVQEGLQVKTAGPLLIARGLEKGPVGDYNDEQAVRAFWSGWRSYMDHVWGTRP